MLQHVNSFQKTAFGIELLQAYSKETGALV